METRPKPDFDLEQLLSELSAMDRESADGVSVAELAERIGRTESWVRFRLRRLHRQGRLTVGWRTSTRIDGHACRQPVYRLKENGR